MHTELWQLHAIFRSIVALKAMKPRANRSTLRELLGSYTVNFGGSSLEKAHRKHFILMDGLSREERLALLSFLFERPITSSYDLLAYELYALLEFGFTENGERVSDDFTTLLTLWKQEVQPCSN